MTSRSTPNSRQASSSSDLNNRIALHDMPEPSSYGSAMNGYGTNPTLAPPQEKRFRSQSITSLLHNVAKPENYAQVRNAYRMKQKSEREGSSGNHILASLLAIFDIRTYFRIAKAVVSSELFDVGITVMDLVSDLLFCTLYLFDIQWALSDAHLRDPTLTSLPAPSWLWISRRYETFLIIFAFSVYKVFSWFVWVTFADNRIAAIFSMASFVNLISAVPFLVSIYFQNARYLYIPYFLTAITAVGSLRKVLRLRGAVPWLNFSNVVEKGLLLGGGLMAIAYVALCLFQYVEFRFADPPNILTINEAFYFVVVTLSTVGYGDITAKSKQGEVVVVLLILTALVVLPSLISSLVETIAQQQGGNGGLYVRGKSKYVVVLGDFQLPVKLDDVLTEIIGESRERLNVVVLGRTPATPAIVGLISSYKYKGRITYLVGSGMEVSDLERAQLRFASAVYIIANRGAEDRRTEDEQNTLRAWAIHKYVPEVPLFVNNLTQDTQSYQEMTTDAAICADDLKQLALGLTVMYDGASTLLINLLRTSSSTAVYDNFWHAQYGDGQANNVHFVDVNPVFAGLRFSEASWYCFREFQITMIAVRVHSQVSGLKTLVLNPGSTYRLSESDEIVFVAQNDEDITMFKSLNKEDFQRTSFNNQTQYDDRSGMLVSPALFKNPPKSQPPVAAVTLSRIQTARERSIYKPVLGSSRSSSSSLGGTDISVNGWTMGIPDAPYDDPHVPVCQLNLSHITLKDSMVDNAETWEGHLLVCTGNYDVFKFVCGLRASHLEVHLRILFLCERPPTEEEFEVLSVFPKLFVMIGDPKKKRALNKAGIRGSRKVVIMNMGVHATDDFAGSGAIMIQHLIHQMFEQLSNYQETKCVVVEVTKRSHITFLHPSPTTSGISYRRRIKSAVNHVANKLMLAERHGTILKPKVKSALGQVSYFYTPIFSSGRVVSASMLDSILFQLHRSPFILELFLMLCGVGGEKVDVGLAELYGVRNSWIGQVKMPHEFVGRTYGELYRELAINQGIIPLGIYRGVEKSLDNKLPYLFTNPPVDVILFPLDLIFVLAP